MRLICLQRGFSASEVELRIEGLGTWPLVPLSSLCPLVPRWEVLLHVGPDSVGGVSPLNVGVGFHGGPPAFEGLSTLAL